MIVELPHHKGGLGITPLPASGMSAFYSATAHLVSWLGSLPHASEWVAGQNLAGPTGCSPVMSAREGQLLNSYMYATLKAALQVLAEIRQRLWEDAKLRFNMSKVKIYIPGVSRERARELFLQQIDSDPSLESLRELYDLDTADPVLGIINVTGLKCVRVPIGTPELQGSISRVEMGRKRKCRRRQSCSLY